MPNFTKKVLFFFTFVTSLLLFTKTTNAQGTFTCNYIEITGACSLDIDNNNCDEGNGYFANEQKCLDLYSSSEACETATFTCETNEEPPPVTGPNKYYCEVLRGSSVCVVSSSGNTCSDGYSPGSSCSTTPLGFCESASFECVPEGEEACGDVGGPCCGNLHCKDESISYCNKNTGLCEACGQKGQICCTGPFACKSGTNLFCGNGICKLIPGQTDPTEISSPTCDDGTGLQTAIGCIPIGDIGESVTFLMNWALGIGGGISFLLIVFAAFQIMTSGGDPKKLQGGKELMTAAIAGLVVLIFSAFLLRTLGFSILGIF